VPRLITLLTDFGTADGYVAEMKGVLYASAPDAVLVDLTHDIPPQDVEAGRLALARAWRRFPPGTIHLAVVDPGVGTTRAAIAVEAQGRFLLGPDNGILSPALVGGGADVVSLPIPPYASATFHGRDVFAPAAARLAAGEALTMLGRFKDDPVLRRTPDTERHADGSITGQVLTVDHFGNVLSNIGARLGGSVTIAGRRVAVCRTYADVPVGSLIALAGSSGFLEVAVRGGSAQALLGVTRGTAIHWSPV
jgi:S-adenosyl-L-methionine hydrolase (adenosine-forming)